MSYIQTWEQQNVHNKPCTAETLTDIIRACGSSHDNYWYVCKALQESGIAYKDLITSVSTNFHNNCLPAR